MEVTWISKYFKNVLERGDSFVTETLKRIWKKLGN